MRQVGVDVYKADQCMYGLKTRGANKHQLVAAKKPTRFRTNSRAVGQELMKRCDGSHEHQLLVEGRANNAARYPRELCRAICRGLRKEKMQRSLQVRAVLEVGQGVHHIIVDPEEFHDKEEMKSGIIASSGLGLEGWNPAACRVST